LPGTDTLAIKSSNPNVISEVCYVESKLRLGSDTKAGQDAYEELTRKHSIDLPIILTFVLKRMHETRHGLLNPFKEYWRDRSVSDDRDAFWIGLTWEKDNWTDTVLGNLETHISSSVTIQSKPKCTVLVARVKELDTVIDDIFQVVVHYRWKDWGWVLRCTRATIILSPFSY